MMNHQNVAQSNISWQLMPFTMAMSVLYTDYSNVMLVNKHKKAASERRPVPVLELKLSHNGMVMVKGILVMVGMYCLYIHAFPFY